MTDRYTCGHEYMTGSKGRSFEVPCPTCYENQKEIEGLLTEASVIQKEVDRLIDCLEAIRKECHGMAASFAVKALEGREFVSTLQSKDDG